MSRLYLRLMCWTIASSILSPAVRSLMQTTMPPNEMTATSLVPPPMSMIIEPAGSVTGRPAPMAAAIGSSMRNVLLEPAWSADSMTARFSTSVMPEGTLTTTRTLVKGIIRQRWRALAFLMK